MLVETLAMAGQRPHARTVVAHLPVSQAPAAPLTTRLYPAYIQVNFPSQITCVLQFLNSASKEPPAATAAPRSLESVAEEHAGNKAPKNSRGGKLYLALGQDHSNSTAGRENLNGYQQEYRWLTWSKPPARV